MPKTIKRKMPKIGKIFSRKFRNKEYIMEVVENNGNIGFKVNNRIN